MGSYILPRRAIASAISFISVISKRYIWLDEGFLLFKGLSVHSRLGN